MTHAPWGNYRTAPLLIKLFGWLCIPATLFFVVHTIIQFIYSDTIIYAVWIDELYHVLWNALPVFLYLSGSMIADKKLRITTNVFIVLYGSFSLLNFGNAYEWVDIPHLQYPQTIALIGLLTTWLIHLFRRKKHILDLFKFIWLFGLTYVFAVPRFVQSGHEAGNFYFASLFAFPVMMGIGLYLFFFNKNHAHE
jgi:hypothetical protein